MPTWNEAKTMTWDETRTITWGDLKLSVDELMRKYANSEIPLTYGVVKKLQALSDELPPKHRRFNWKTAGDAVSFCNAVIGIAEKLDIVDRIKSLLGIALDAIKSLF